jgi:hypothetical protein
MAMGELISVGAKYIREAKYINLFIYLFIGKQTIFMTI